MATPDEQVDEDVCGQPSEEKLASWKRKSTQKRKQIATTRNEIDSTVASRGYRSAIKGSVGQLQQLHLKSCHLHTEIMSYKDDVTENHKQNAIHIRYIQQSGETYDWVENYLDSRLKNGLKGKTTGSRRSYGSKCTSSC